DAIRGWYEPARSVWTWGFDTSSLLALNAPFTTVSDKEKRERGNGALYSKLFSGIQLTTDSIARGIVNAALGDSVCPISALHPVVGHPDACPWILTLQGIWDAFHWTKEGTAPPGQTITVDTLINLISDQLKEAKLEAYPTSITNGVKDTTTGKPKHYANYFRYIRIVGTGEVAQPQPEDDPASAGTTERSIRKLMAKKIRLNPRSKRAPEFVTKEMDAFVKEHTTAARYLDTKGPGVGTGVGLYYRRIFSYFDWRHNPLHRAPPDLATATYESAHSDRKQKAPTIPALCMVAYLLVLSNKKLQVPREDECKLEVLFDGDNKRKFDLRHIHLLGLITVDYDTLSTTKILPPPGKANSGIRLVGSSDREWTLM
ncbi:hypothetical protein P7C70_g9415, partial [Phenoliferia sp. Uapishka_3]